MPEQMCVPELVVQAVATQVVPEHEAVATFVVGHGAQTPPHSLELVAQVTPHAVPSQVAVPFAGAGQAVHDVAPHDATLVLAEQVPEHGW
jgi:hypothetical protein